MSSPTPSNVPLVSIITMTLNRADYVAACLDSVLHQTYPHIEHILVDGASKDGTVDILARYASRHPDRIRYLTEPDKGSGDAWNKGLRLARGEILGWIGSDDRYKPDAVASVVEFFRAHSDASFVYGGIDQVNGTGALIGTYRPRPFSHAELINERCVIPTPASFYKRAVIDTVGGFDDLGNDLDFFMRVAKKFPIQRLDQVLAEFRIHDQSATSGTNVPVRKMWLREDCLVSRRHGARFFSGYCRRYYRYAFVYSLPAWLRPLGSRLTKITLSKERT